MAFESGVFIAGEVILEYILAPNVSIKHELRMGDGPPETLAVRWQTAVQDMESDTTKSALDLMRDYQTLLKKQFQNLSQWLLELDVARSKLNQAAQEKLGSPDKASMEMGVEVLSILPKSAWVHTVKLSKTETFMELKKNLCEALGATISLAQIWKQAGAGGVTTEQSVNYVSASSGGNAKGSSASSSSNGSSRNTSSGKSHYGSASGDNKRKESMTKVCYYCEGKYGSHLKQDCPQRIKDRRNDQFWSNIFSKPKPDTRSSVRFDVAAVQKVTAKQKVEWVCEEKNGHQGGNETDESGWMSLSDDEGGSVRTTLSVKDLCLAATSEDGEEEEKYLSTDQFDVGHRKEEWVPVANVKKKKKNGTPLIQVMKESITK